MPKAKGRTKDQGLSFLGDVAALVRSHLNGLSLQPFEGTIEQTTEKMPP